MAHSPQEAADAIDHRERDLSNKGYRERQPSKPGDRVQRSQPSTSTSGNADAPLSQWTKRPTTYRTKEVCEHVLDRQQRLTNVRNRQVVLQFDKKAQFVPRQDPRLKPN